MSAQYWQMKLGNSYVNCEGKYRRVQDLRIDEDARGMNVGMYPEDYLHCIEFRLGERGRWRKYEQFGIEWPHEQYKLVDDKAVWAGRRMAKQYKLAPSTDSYQVERGTVSLEEWLNTPEPRYSKPNQVLEKSEDMVFTPECAMKTHTPANSTIFVCQREMIQVKRTPEKVTLDSVARLPQFVTDMFGNMLGRDLKYTGKLPEPIEEQGLDVPPDGMEQVEFFTFKKVVHFNWMRMHDDTAQRNLGDWQYCFITDVVEEEHEEGYWGEEERPVAILFGYNGEHHMVYDQIDAGNFNPRVEEDLQVLLAKGDIDR